MLQDINKIMTSKQGVSSRRLTCSELCAVVLANVFPLVSLVPLIRLTKQIGRALPYLQCRHQSRVPAQRFWGN
jgi:hypothetical protein